MSLNSYKDLLVWQRARELVKEVYSLYELLPPDQKYGLVSQMQRAAISIPSNIAEGYRRNNRKEYIQFLGIAAGSAAELETQLILSEDLFNVDNTLCLGALEEVQKMLYVLSKKLSSPLPLHPRP